MSRTDTSRRAVLDISDTPAIPFATLTRVELRKAFDTRAGRWYTIAIAGLVLLIVLAVALLFTADEQTQSYNGFLGFLAGVLGFFLPVLPILLVTGEWGQRTALTTFALEPRRPRVIAAKLVASLLQVVALFVVSFVLAAGGVLLAALRGISPDWSLPSTDVRAFVVANLIKVLVGFAFAMLLLNSAAAIVAYFAYSTAVPLVFAIVGYYVGWFGDLVPWIELNAAQGPLFDGGSPSGEEWAQLGTAAVVWLVIPFSVGLSRILRAEVK